ncbi:MAG: hypothetical protein V1754_09970, partial [Pseudomonadota bacterium]
MRSNVQGKPSFINRQKFPLVKIARQAIGNQPQFTGNLQLELDGDPSTMSLKVSVPFVVEDGSGAYVERLTYTKATTGFSRYT